MVRIEESAWLVCNHQPEKLEMESMSAPRCHVLLYSINAHRTAA